MGASNLTVGIPLCLYYINNYKIEGQCTQKVTMRGVRAAIFAVEKQHVLYTLSVCLLPYVHSMQRACAILSSVACPALQYFSALSHKRHDFRKKKVIE
jgi:hypothetical protein